MRSIGLQWATAAWGSYNLKTPTAQGGTEAQPMLNNDVEHSSPRLWVFTLLQSAQKPGHGALRLGYFFHALTSPFPCLPFRRLYLLSILEVENSLDFTILWLKYLHPNML